MPSENDQVFLTPVNTPRAVLLKHGVLIGIYIVIGFFAMPVCGSNALKSSGITMLSGIRFLSFLLLILNGYFYLCILIRLFLSMTNTDIRQGFWRSGTRILPQSILFGLFLIVVSLIIYSIPQSIFMLVTHKELSMSTIMNPTLFVVTEIAVVVLCLYMFPMIVISKCHPLSDYLYAKGWTVAGLKFFRENIKKSLMPVSLLVIATGLSSLLSVLLKNSSFVVFIVTAFVYVINGLLGIIINVVTLYILLDCRWNPFTEGPPRMKKVFETADAEKAKAAQNVLYHNNIEFTMYPGFSRAVQLMEESKIHEVGIFVKEGCDCGSAIDEIGRMDNTSAGETDDN